MIRFNNKEDIIALTPQWKGERFADGRPRVPDKYLEKMRKMTLEELWKPIFVKGYESQFEGDLKVLHDDGRILIGRAVTATFVPTRPDLHEVMFGVGAEEGRKGNYNQWVIDSLTEGDVVVADMYDKIYKGTFLGGNLTTAIKTKTKTGGGVIVPEVVDGAAKTHVKDDFGFEMIVQNKFTTAQIDRATWTEEMLDMLTDWIQKDPRGEKYRDLDWSPEYEAARNGDPNDTQTML